MRAVAPQKRRQQLELQTPLRKRTPLRAPRALATDALRTHDDLLRVARREAFKGAHGLAGHPGGVDDDEAVLECGVVGLVVLGERVLDAVEGRVEDTESAEHLEVRHVEDVHGTGEDPLVARDSVEERVLRLRGPHEDVEELGERRELALSRYAVSPRRYTNSADPDPSLAPSWYPHGSSAIKRLNSAGPLATASPAFLAAFAA
eukprot:CAMPEP_0184715962 /NCGR_PEP_ID=MMETSP0314-20130426/5815_1 /TAXON_ID=38298 /ORGANISM="Rhodella maculata, Strain CCMP 736" /LENGTH=203 /DNA_ID=CAMNT_0027179259 /DNA_START=214 /DNA_END=822 /DNA_ORIENTATION=-